MNDPLPPNRATLFEAIDPVLELYIKTIFVRNDKFSFDRIPARGTALKETFLNQSPGCDGIQNWVFTYIEPHRTDGWHAFHFVKPFTVQETQTPVLTQTRFGDHPWDAILRAIYLVPDYTVMRSTRMIDGSVSLSPTYGLYYDLVSPAKKGTLFLEEFFLSNTPFVVPQTKTPVTRDIAVPIPGGAHFTFHDVLCPDLKIERVITSAGSIATTGDRQSSTGGSIPGQNIPATNFPTWRPYVDRADPDKINGGLFGLKVTTVFPPKVPKPITLIA